MADKETNPQDESTCALIKSITAEIQKSVMNEIEARLSTLSLLTSLLSHQQQASLPLIPPPSSGTQMQLPPASQAPRTPQAGFVPPLTATSASGMYETPYIDHSFPHEKNQKKTLQLIGNSLEIASNETTLKDFKDITLLMIPLQVYFGIVVHYASPSSAAALSKLFQYTANLHKVASEYTWATVVNYHVNFFLCHRQEMRRGYYNLWAHQDSKLASKFLHAHCKTAGSSTISLKKTTVM
ncbi:hypothetical protein H1R20_g573, partial [Candolleomyces eurysporus]